MGFFLERFGLKAFNEIEVDGKEMNPNQQSNDYTDNDENVERPNEEEQADYRQNNADEQTEGNYGQEEGNMPPQEDTTDYTQQGYEDSGDNRRREAPPPPEENDQPVDDFKKQEEELYGDLTPEQLDIKHRELKNQFLSMYDITTTIIDRIGDASISKENIGIAQYISNNLIRLREMLTDYMQNVYQGKSYIENSINYNRFLAVLNGINKILEEVDKKEDK